MGRTAAAGARWRVATRYDKTATSSPFWQPPECDVCRAKCPVAPAALYRGPVRSEQISVRIPADRWDKTCRAPGHGPKREHGKRNRRFGFHAGRPIRVNKRVRANGFTSSEQLVNTIAGRRYPVHWPLGGICETAEFAFTPLPDRVAQ
ncbi:hypothetical protein GCM10009863_19680 [Streptomyces axinellae]|uniref:Uncharacterized protein n=1 Tax=Streptomyces axinellae TaxID=552788 RepID=A0ABN3PWT1_9ACTN